MIDRSVDEFRRPDPAAPEAPSMSTPDPSTAPASPLSADTALVLVSQAGAVRQLTLNRPAALNSFTAAMPVSTSRPMEP
jgi:hypothetical protein